MKALVFHGDSDIRLEEVSLPVIKEHEALIKVKAVGICGSDVQGYMGKTGRRVAPMIMGHEFSGVVEQVGSAVTKVKLGDKVAIFPYHTCGTCPSCQSNMTNACPNKTMFGVFTTNGAMTEYVAADEGLLFPLPVGVDCRHGSLAEPLSVAARGVNKASVQGKNVVIIGAGTIGLMALLLVKLQQAQDIVVLDLSDDRLALATKLGADMVINSQRDDAAVRLAERYLKSGGADVVIEAVGFEGTLQQSLALAARGGQVVVVGMAQKSIAIDMHEFISKEVLLIGSFLYDRSQFGYIVDSLPALKESLDKLMTHCVPLVQGVAMYQRLAQGEPGLVKVILTNE